MKTITIMAVVLMLVLTSVGLAQGDGCIDLDKWCVTPPDGFILDADAAGGSGLTFIAGTGRAEPAFVAEGTAQLYVIDEGGIIPFPPIMAGAEFRLGYAKGVYETLIILGALQNPDLDITRSFTSRYMGTGGGQYATLETAEGGTWIIVQEGVPMVVLRYRTGERELWEEAVEAVLVELNEQLVD